MIKKVILLQVFTLTMGMENNTLPIIESVGNLTSICISDDVFQHSYCIAHYDPNKTEIISSTVKTPSIEEKWAVFHKTDQVNLQEKKIESVWTITSVIIPNEKKP